MYFLAQNPQAPVSAPTVSAGTASPTPLVLSVTAQADAAKPETVEKEVHSYFSDIPIMVSIARCESQYHQWNGDGSVHRGVVNHYDVGVMQVNELYHADEATKLGLDLSTLNGNMAYARYLYEHEGTAPWSSSAKCWGKDADKLAAK